MFLSTIKIRLELLFYFQHVSKNWFHTLLCVYGLKKPKKIICLLREGTKFSIHRHPVDLVAIIESWVPQWGHGYFCEFNEIKPKNILIDVGAHIGTFSVYMKKRNPQIKVYAYEPDPSNYKLLCENIALNSLTNIFPKNIAIGDKKKTVTLYAKKGRNFGTMGSSIIRKSDVKTSIPCISLLDVLNENHISKCDLLKIDCEGAEYEILLSQGHSCFDKIDSIVLEFHRIEGFSYSENDLVNHLVKFGFNVKKTIVGSNRSGFLYAIKDKK